MQIKVALVGNPNCGKTTLFNAYTGAKHKVGNWAGVTVEKKEGHIKHDGHEITLVDLPGIYSLSPYTMEEILTRNYILEDQPDVVVNIADASNLVRNLFLTLQLIELGKPVILALNMMDIIEERGFEIDTVRLAEELGIAVVPISAAKHKGLTKLLHQVIKTKRLKNAYVPVQINYGPDINLMIEKLSEKLAPLLGKPKSYNRVRWTAIKLMEHDTDIIDKIGMVDPQMPSFSEEIGRRKYEYIDCFMEEVLHTFGEDETFSDRVDKIVTHNLFGIPIFILMMALVFAFTFTVGNQLADVLDQVLIAVSHQVRLLLSALGVAQWLTALIVEGVIGGVGGMLIFLPNIACLFIAISILEDSGYMARVALLTDKLMCRLGLNGKAFIPMILGFGCSVPAIMTARTLENEKDRLVVAMITPFMSCSARMPIYVLFSKIFFPGLEVWIAFSLYILGVIVAIIVALAFKKIMGKGSQSGLILELPGYKKPSFKSVFLYAWEKVKDYITRAGTIIFTASVVLWFVLSFGPQGYVQMTESYGAMFGRVLAPIFIPLGFGTWEAALSLLAGILGKEIVVSSMAVIYGVADSGFAGALTGAGFTSLSAYAFMVFCLLYTPCVATIAVIKKETGSWKWMFFSLAYQFAIAWIVAMAVFQLGSLM